MNIKLAEVEIPPVGLRQLDEAALFNNATRQRLADAPDAIVYEYFLDEESLGYAEFYENGALKCLRPWRAGRRDGSWQDFYESGVLMRHEEFKLGIQIGPSLRWHENWGLAFASQCDTVPATTASWDSFGNISHWRQMESKSATAFVCVACRHRTYWTGWDHAGFSERGYAYNEAGNFVISWDAADPAYIEILGEKIWPWRLSPEQKALIETRLKCSPSGGRFLFSNPARCERCANPISSVLPDCFYLWEPEKMIRTGLDEKPPQGQLINYLK